MLCLWSGLTEDEVISLPTPAGSFTNFCELKMPSKQGSKSRDQLTRRYLMILITPSLLSRAVRSSPMSRKTTTYLCTVTVRMKWRRKKGRRRVRDERLPRASERREEDTCSSSHFFLFFRPNPKLYSCSRHRIN